MMQIDQALTSETWVYRYLSFESFVAFLETRRTMLTNINRWDDRWEAILGKVPTVNERGEPTPSLYSFHQDIFAQSWTLLDESDAMWRIYSPTKTGLQIRTSVGNFELIQGVERAHVGKITYFTSKAELLAASASVKSPFDDALLKRAAFDHEREIRYLTNGQFLQNRVSIHEPSVTLPLDPVAFIEGVTVDPRAEDWFLQAVEAYSKRAELRCVPNRSSLYEPEPELKLGINRRWVPIENPRK